MTDSSVSGPRVRSILVYGVLLSVAGLILVVVGFCLGRATRPPAEPYAAAAPAPTPASPVPVQSPTLPPSRQAASPTDSSLQVVPEPSLSELRDGLRDYTQRVVDNSEMLQSYVISRVEVFKLTLEPTEQEYHREAFRAGYDYQGVSSLIAPNPGYDRMLCFLHKRGKPVEEWEYDPNISL